MDLFLRLDNPELHLSNINTQERWEFLDFSGMSFIQAHEKRLVPAITLAGPFLCGMCIGLG